MSKKIVRAISLKQKLQIIKELDENVSKKTICEKYRCNLSTVNRILKNKLHILKCSEDTSNLKTKRQRKGLHDQVEKALLLWFNDKSQNNCIINSSMLLNKAKEIASDLGDNYEPDTSWLFRWKKRYNIKVGKIHGKSASSDETDSSDNIGSVLSDIIKNYDPQDIMNAKESGLFYKNLPSTTYYRAGAIPPDYKKQEARLTVLFICNATGTFKRIYVIGKSKNPSCLKNVNPPVPYMSNDNAWMNVSIWQDIMQSLDNELQKLNRKIVLFVNNASCHKSVYLNNIDLYFLPQNTTCLIQPLEQGIIHTFKIYYRQIIAKKQLSALERDMSLQEFYKSISLLDALYFIKRAWWLVRPKTISNCFKKAKFYEAPSAGGEITENNECLELASNYESYIGYDDDLECYESLTDTDIVDAVRTNQTVKIEILDSDDSEEQSTNVLTLKEVLTALDVVQKYCLLNNIDGTLNEIENAILKQSLRSIKQTTINEYFSKIHTM